MSAILAALAAASAIAGVHQYERVAISPDGALVAAVESVEVPGRSQDPHATLVLRRAGAGTVVGSYDPCAACAYADPAWSPDGASLAFVASDRRARTATLALVTGGKVTPGVAF